MPLLQQAMERGCVLTGGSAGAICWFDSGHSDSMDPDSYRSKMVSAPDSGGDESSALAQGEDAKDWAYIKIPCLGLLPGLCCPHHDQVRVMLAPCTQSTALIGSSGRPPAVRFGWKHSGVAVSS